MLTQLLSVAPSCALSFLPQVLLLNIWQIFNALCASRLPLQMGFYRVVIRPGLGASYLLRPCDLLLTNSKRFLHEPVSSETPLEQERLKRVRNSTPGGARVLQIWIPLPFPPLAPPILRPTFVPGRTSINEFLIVYLTLNIHNNAIINTN